MVDKIYISNTSKMLHSLPGLFSHVKMVKFPTSFLINPYWTIVPFWDTLKTENLNVFWCFQEVHIGNIGLMWVKKTQKPNSIHLLLLTFWNFKRKFWLILTIYASVIFLVSFFLCLFYFHYKFEIWSRFPVAIITT